MAGISLQELRSGGKRALARALAAVEQQAGTDTLAALLDQAYGEPRAHVIGLTGPPGVGKSTLTNAVIAAWRARGLSVGVIAVDPSSRVTGGALLGDRTRIAKDPEDDQVFVRSMAARDRLGGLSELTIASMVLMRAVFDRVIVESVGVGQSEADIVHAADTVVFCVQPASGDSLQFMKAGIVEIPDIAVVTKSDMGAAAQRARADVKGALGLAVPGGSDWTVPVLAVSATKEDGLDELLAAFDEHFGWLRSTGRLETNRHAQAQEWLRQAVQDRFGREGLRKAGEHISLTPGQGPFGREIAIVRDLGALLHGG